MTFRKILVLTGLLLVLGCTSAQGGGPIIDPFLEAFQVGRFADPADIALAGGYPADLWEPCRVDSSWILTAANLIAGTGEAPDPEPVIVNWLHLDALKGRTQPWAKTRRMVLEQLLGAARGTQPPAASCTGLLGCAQLTSAFFAALDRADTVTALALAQQLADTDFAGCDNASLRFVWTLRLRALGARAGLSPEDPEDPWPTLFDLGPFDARSGWAIWSAHRQARNLPLLTRRHATPRQAAVLAGLSPSGLTPADLDASRFPLEIKTGLGAQTLKGDQRRQFLKRYSRPPWDSQAQGWWVAGQRAVVAGQAAAYENLATRNDLRSGWRMDLWRRASELHLLKGQWKAGVSDLKRALGLAEYGAGSAQLRTRVAQWTAQAMALAVAQGDSGQAAMIYALGRQRLPKGQKSTFLVATGSWFARPDSLDRGIGEVAALAQDLVRRGSAPILVPASSSSSLPQSGPLRLGNWRAWAACRSSVEMQDLSAASSPAQARAEALKIVAEILGTERISDSLLDIILTRDVYLASGGRGGAPCSAWPEFKAMSAGLPLVQHGLLGLAVAQQDLRAVVGLAWVMGGDALPSTEKLHFLYPVPAFGPTRQALDQAASEPALLLAVARNESMFDPGARSRAGALGWMQVMPGHLYGGEVEPGTGHWADPRVSIGTGDKLLEQDRQRFAGDPYLVLAAYNAGPTAAKRWLNQLGGHADPALYLAWIGYPETRGYVEKVLRDRAIYAGILGQARDLEADSH